MVDGQDETEKPPPEDMSNTDNDEIKKLPIKERLECRRLQAEAQKHQAEAREHGKSLFKKPAFCSAIAPVILAFIIFLITFWFDLFNIQQKYRETLTSEIKMLKKELINKEKAQDELIALRGEEVAINKEKTQDEVIVLQYDEKSKTVDLSEQLQETVDILKQYAKKLAQVKPDENIYSFEDWYSKGAGEFLDKKYDKAIDSFTKALDKEPERFSKAYTYNYRGTAYSLSGRDDEALEDYDKSIKLKPDNPLPYRNRVIIYYGRKEYGKSVEELNKMTEKYIIKGEYVEALMFNIKASEMFKKINIEEYADIEKAKEDIKEKIEELKKSVKWEEIK